MKWALNLARYSPSSECECYYCYCSNCCYLKRRIDKNTRLVRKSNFQIAYQNYSIMYELTASKATQARRVAAAALRWFWIRHRISPEFLTQKRQRGELLPILGLAHRPWQCQLDRQFVTVSIRERDESMNREGSFLIETMIDLLTVRCERKRFLEKMISLFSYSLNGQLIQQLFRDSNSNRTINVLMTVIERVDRLQKFQFL